MKASIWVPLALLALAGCQETLITVHTAPPPGRVAEVRDEVVTLSSQVAVALECTYSDYDRYYSAPCPELSVELADESVAEIREAVLDLPEPGYGPSSGTGRSVVVLVGKEAGSTAITFRHEFTELSWQLSVVESAVESE